MKTPEILTACRECATPCEFKFKIAHIREKGCQYIQIERPDPALPSILTMSANYVAAQTRDVLAGRPRRTPEEAEAIFATHCQPCEWLRASDQRCSKCGCPVRSKIPMLREHCPVGKW